MKGFRLDRSGDVVMENGDIALVDGNDLLRQTCETVVGTNQGEWRFNLEEGIDFSAILMKNPDLEVIESEVLAGLQQVDETFQMEVFQCSIDRQTRQATTTFTASNDSGETVTGMQII